MPRAAASAGLLIALLLTALVAPSMTQQQGRTEELLGELKNNVIPALRRSIWGFWACHGVDHAGGFHATLSRTGEPVPPTDKGIVQQARHAWAFSTFVKYGFNTAGDQQQQASSQPGHRCPAGTAAPSSSEQMAHTAYRFVVDHLRSPQHPGMFGWKAAADGSSLVQPRSVLYGQSFAIYALSQFAAVFGSAEAKQHALDCFRAVSQAWHSSSGGFNELASNSIPSDDDAGGDRQLPRSLNNLMHGLEALAALHRLTADAQVLQQLLEGVDILCNKLQRVRGLLVEEYTPRPDGEGHWQPVAGSLVSYGHNLEATWLLADTLAHLRAAGAMPQAKADAYRSSIMDVGAAAAAEGYDAQHGGVFEYGSQSQKPGSAAAPTSSLKVWWVQAESMLALWQLYEATGQLGYLEKLAGTARFVQQFLDDAGSGGPGEQFWQVSADGKQLEGYSFKGSEWKASYHSSRAVLFLERWMHGRAT